MDVANFEQMRGRGISDREHIHQAAMRVALFVIGEALVSGPMEVDRLLRVAQYALEEGLSAGVAVVSTLMA